MTDNSKDDLQDFLSKPPVAETASGLWIEIETPAEAMLMQAVSETAVGIFYDHVASGTIQAADGLRWLALVNPDQETPLEALLAAQPTDGFQADKWPFESHITGYRNAMVDEDIQQEIMDVAQSQGLAVTMNHMGTVLIENPASPEDEDDGMEP